MKTISELDLFNLQIIRTSVEELIKHASKDDNEDMLLLEVAPQIHKGAKEFFKKAKVETLDIDIKSDATYIADLCNNNSQLIPSNRFDIIICTEVLEHTLNPFSASEELLRILKPGGKCYVSTPFNFRIHGPLPDCWRFTEYGLKSLFKNFSKIEIKEIESKDRFLMPIHYQTILIK